MKYNNKNILKNICLSLVVLSFIGCGKSDLSIPKIEYLPKEKITVYHEPLYLLGKMLKIYSDKKVYIMSKDITDNTGVSRATGGEIPFNITEMVRSACNKIGKQVVYVPYDPSLLLNETHLGVKFDRVVPDVLITGGITEYDRTQVSDGSSFNFSTFFGSGSRETDVGLNGKDVNSVSTISFDLNLVDYKKMVMIPQVQSLHSIRVFNLTKGGGFSFAIDGTGIGFSKQKKSIQGRHDAVRQLVELSVLELIGKYKKIPYWRTLKGYEKHISRTVSDTIKEYYNTLDNTSQIKAIQELLPYYGYKDLKINGEKDTKTIEVLNEINKKYKFSNKLISMENYLSLYFNIPFKNEIM